MPTFESGGRRRTATPHQVPWEPKHDGQFEVALHTMPTWLHLIVLVLGGKWKAFDPSFFHTNLCSQRELSDWGTPLSADVHMNTVSDACSSSDFEANLLSERRPYVPVEGSHLPSDRVGRARQASANGSKE